MKINSLASSVLAGSIITVGSGFSVAMAENSFNVSGFIRAQTSILLEDHDETPGDDKGEFSMARASVKLEFDAQTGDVSWKAITRFDQEHETDYLKELDEITESIGFGGTSQRGDYLDQYNTNEIEEILREFYVDFTLGDRVDVRLGRQQLVWGESDFFQALDLVHGFDYRSRLFYENNEDWRKPLILANFNVDVPELDGSLNFYIRPALDRDEDMGSNYNIEGGRWIPHPYRGVDFTAFTEYNTGHSKGDWDDPTYGIRWRGFMGSAGYSIAYLKTFNPAPVMNPNTVSGVAALFGVNPAEMRSYGEAAKNPLLGDWIFPEIDVFGVTVNDYFQSIDSTLSAEVAFIPDKPFNYGSLNSSLPGWSGIIEKDVVQIMLRVDKELKLMDWLGTNRPSLSSIQFFDTWILNYDDDDEIVEFASFGSKKKEHTMYLTFFSLLNFNRDTINPSLVLGTDLSNGGGFAIPAVEFVIGDNWRFKAEADLWWNDGDKKQIDKSAPAGNPLAGGRNPLGTPENSASFMDWFADDNQLTFTLTYQF